MYTYVRTQIDKDMGRRGTIDLTSGKKKIKKITHPLPIPIPHSPFLSPPWIDYRTFVDDPSPAAEVRWLNFVGELLPLAVPPPPPPPPYVGEEMSGNVPVGSPHLSTGDDNPA